MTERIYNQLPNQEMKLFTFAAVLAISTAVFIQEDATDFHEFTTEIPVYIIQMQIDCWNTALEYYQGNEAGHPVEYYDEEFFHCTQHFNNEQRILNEMKELHDE